MTQTNVKPHDPRKFQDPDITAEGEPRATVSLKKLETLWFNTGTLCNLTCVNCYIESSPRNDRLVYIAAEEVREYLDEIERGGLGTREIGFTGGEPFMNPDIIRMMEDCLLRGFKVLVLSNAMRPMMKLANRLIGLKENYGKQLTIRVSIDHYTRELHEKERGLQTWEPMIEGLKWLAENEFDIAIAGRTYWDESEACLREGYAGLFAEMNIDIDAQDPIQLVLFPEMDETVDVPEITTGCWDILDVSPDDIMCASSRMIVKRKGAARPVVLSCTLLPYDSQFEMGETLAEASGDVKLNHLHCAKFCVLGGGGCSKL